MALKKTSDDTQDERDTDIDVIKRAPGQIHFNSITSIIENTNLIKKTKT